MSDPVTAATALLSFKMADRCENMQNDNNATMTSVKAPNVKQTSFASNAALIKRYLWAVGQLGSQSAEAVPSRKQRGSL